MDALLKMQSTPSSTDFIEQIDILKKCMANKENVDESLSPAKEFEVRAQSLIDRVDNSAGQNPQDATERPEHRVTAESFLELVKVTEQLTKLEMVAAQTRGCEAVSSDAKKWQDLTSVALDWSLKSLSEQQRASIDKLSQLLMRSSGAAKQELPASSFLQSPAVPKPALQPQPAASVQPQKPLNNDVPPGFEPDAKSTPSGFEQGETLRTHLEVLANEDPNRILIVRRINRLGFDSPVHLEEKFSEFGTVNRVFVAHSRVKPSTKRPVPRVRPAGLGFVLMESTEDAHKIASVGPQMMINNVSVEVKLYEPGSMGTGKGQLDENDESQ
jgi:hypothetical protein